MDFHVSGSLVLAVADQDAPRQRFDQVLLSDGEKGVVADAGPAADRFMLPTEITPKANRGRAIWCAALRHKPLDVIGPDALPVRQCR